MQNYPIDATIHGEHYTLRINRDHVAAIDRELGDSSYAAMKRFIAGEWRASDVEVVIDRAIHPPTPPEILMGFTMVRGEPSLIRRAIRERGAVIYADLAANLLIGAMIGHPIPPEPFTDGSEVIDAA